MLLLKILCVVYVALFVWLLMASGPAEFIKAHGYRTTGINHFDLVCHFLGFVLLSVATLGLRWIVPRWLVAVGLVVCAVGTEWGQYLMPGRTPDVADGLHNLAGIAVGGAICFAAGVFLAARRSTSTC